MFCVIVFLTSNELNMENIGQPKLQIIICSQITKYSDCSYVYSTLHFSHFLNFLANSAKSLKQVALTQFEMDWWILWCQSKERKRRTDTANLIAFLPLKWPQIIQKKP